MIWRRRFGRGEGNLEISRTRRRKVGNDRAFAHLADYRPIGIQSSSPGIRRVKRIKQVTRCDKTCLSYGLWPPGFSGPGSPGFPGALGLVDVVLTAFT